MTAWPIEVLADMVWVHRFEPGASLPELPPGWRSVTTTAHERSVACSSATLRGAVSSVGPLRVIGVAQVLDHQLVGVLSSLLVPLAEAGVSVIPVGTFDTDYILVAASDLDRAVAALEGTGAARRVTP